MSNFLTRHKKILSICLTVVCSVFVVALVVSAATTIGANITTTGNLSVTGTAGVTGLATFVKSTSTLSSVYDGLYVGSTATTTISGTTTSTFAASMLVNESGANTSTVQVGHASSSGGQGGCIAMAADDGVILYLIVSNAGDHYEFTTSTVASDCGY